MENDFQRLFEKMDKIIDEASNQQKNYRRRTKDQYLKKHWFN